MQNLNNIADKAIEYAKQEINKYGMPSMLQFNLSLEKGIDLAKQLGANVEIVKIGIALMDLKLGEAAAQGKQAEHVKISSEYSEDFLNDFALDTDIKEILINCVDAHHAKVPYQTLEAEICANADCYRFIHPKGVLYYMTVVAHRFNDFNKELSQVESKLDEKMQIASIPKVKEELSAYYQVFKEYILLCRD